MGKWQSRRGAKSRGPTRHYSAHESAAWSHRPWGCNNLKEALEGYAERDEKRIEQRQRLDWLKENAKRRRDYDAIPEWCHRNEHPLRTGRPGRWYRKSDVVGPILDAMQMLHEVKSGGDALNLFAEMDVQKKKRRKKDGYDEAEEKEQARIERKRVLRDDPAAAYAENQRRMKAPAWECACCGNTDIKTQVQHKDALLCPCGFVVRMGGEIISTHREKLGAEEGEDKTQHADKPREQRVHWADSDHVPTVTERRNERKYSAQVTKIGGRSGGKYRLGRLCDVQQITVDMAGKDERTVGVANGTKLTPKDETKGWNIIAQINELAKALSPVEHEVKKKLRTEADRVWHRAVRHCRSCTRADCCELRLIERTPAIIAASVFETTIERLLHSESESVRVSRQHLLDVQMRMQRSSTFTNTPAITQMNTAKAMINIMQAPDFDPEIICAPSLPKPSGYTSTGALFRDEAKPRPSLLAMGRAPFSRNDSTVSCDGASPVPTDAVLMRDAVSTVFLAHRSELPIAVRDGALRAVQSPGFVEAVNKIDGIRSGSLHCAAFCILNAVRREQAAEPGPSFVSNAAPIYSEFNVGIAMKLNLDLAIAEESIASIRALVPTDATSEASAGNDDDLFS